jgi:hypothetical protein
MVASGNQLLFSDGTGLNAGAYSGAYYPGALPMPFGAPEQSGVGYG